MCRLADPRVSGEPSQYQARQDQASLCRDVLNVAGTLASGVLFFKCRQ